MQSCIKDNIDTVSGSLEVHSSYSVPAGDVYFNFSDRFDQLMPGSDTVFYDDTYYLTGDTAILKTERILYDFLNSGTIVNQHIQAITFRMIIENWYPVTTSMEVYLADENLDQVGPVIADSSILEPAEVDGNNVVVSPSVIVRDIPVPLEILINYEQIRYMILDAWLNVADQGAGRIVFTDTQYIRIHIGARVEIGYNVNEL